jgi:serine/threonine protein phosphatase PrpC
MTVLTSWAAATSTGRVRAHNEDAAYAGRWLFAVADGMGGHVGGEIASAAVITALRACDMETDAAELLNVLSRALTHANGELRHQTEADPGLAGMGTTLTAMLWSGHTYALAHIGDSRAYMLRGGRLRQLTEDHALSNLVADSRTSSFLAPVLTRYLDGRPDRSPDLGLREALPGDRYLLCSDGLTAVVPDKAIREVLTTGDDLARIAGQLTELANSAGGPDNTSAIVIDTLASPVPSPAPPTAFGAAAR